MAVVKASGIICEGVSVELPAGCSHLPVELAAIVRLRAKPQAGTVPRVTRADPTSCVTPGRVTVAEKSVGGKRDGEEVEQNKVIKNGTLEPEYRYGWSNLFFS